MQSVMSSFYVVVSDSTPVEDELSDYDREDSLNLSPQPFSQIIPPNDAVVTSEQSAVNVPSSSESSAITSSVNLVNDIGSIIMPTKSVSDISRDIDGLSSSSKYSLLYNHVTPPLVLPSIYSHGCNRKFNTTWLAKYPWLRYSPSLDGVFCGPCSLLILSSKRSNKSTLVNKPFSNWVKISDTLANTLN